MDYEYDCLLLGYVSLGNVSSICAFLIAMSIEMVPKSWKYCEYW